MAFLSCDRGAQKPLPDADDIGVGGNRDPAAHFLDTVEIARQVVEPADPVNPRMAGTSAVQCVRPAIMTVPAPMTVRTAP